MSNARRHPWRYVAWNATWITALSSSCALTPEPIDQFLQPVGDDAPATQLATLDVRCAAALEAARAEPENIDLALEASRLLFADADLRMQTAIRAAIQRDQLTSIADILGAEDVVDDEAEAAILSLASEGVTLAQRVVLARAADVAGHLHLALHLSFVAWANGKARSLMAGYGPRIVAAMDRAVELDAHYDGSAPLRLQGRFRARAPWPYGDSALAKQALERAAEHAPLPITRLFLGDLYYEAGEVERAREQWKAALTAAADASTEWSAPIVRELAALRCSSIASEAP